MRSLSALGQICGARILTKPGRHEGTFSGAFRVTPNESVRAYLRFALNRYCTPTEIAKFTSFWVYFVP